MEDFESIMEIKENSRLDAVLVSLGFASGREKAKEIIRQGLVKVNGITVTKPAISVTKKDDVVCDESARPQYVGRGGFKLEKALQMCPPAFTLRDKICMDVGASTGGFTDCMLQNGARQVYAVDVGREQLHEKLRQNPCVVNLEGIDIRNTEKISVYIPQHTVQFCSIDVSFISVKKIVASLLPFLEKDAVICLLIKPQFEAGRQAIGKNGVVRGKTVHCRVVEDVLMCLQGYALGCQALSFSPITGGEGNIEYLAVLVNGGKTCPQSVADIVKQAHQALNQK